jgi:excinuclease ABC subunit C
MDQAPLRIECYDISHTQGAEVVASMVVFEDALPRKSEYRRFTIKTVEGQDDVRSMHEVISRRFKRYLAEASRAGEALLPDAEFEDNGPTSTEAEADADAEAAEIGSAEETADLAADEAPAPTVREDKPLSRSAYPPQLVLVDGGAPQVAAAARALAELGIEEVAVAGIAKRMEEIWQPGEEDPVILPRTSEALYLLQRVRDEAHRFAITFHRQRRSKAMTAGGLLDGIPGLGEVRRKALLKHFGSVKAVRAAGVDELAAVPGLGRATAEVLHEAIAQRSRSSTRPAAVNTATGELLEDSGN